MYKRIYIFTHAHIYNFMYMYIFFAAKWSKRWRRRCSSSWHPLMSAPLLLHCYRRSLILQLPALLLTLLRRTSSSRRYFGLVCVCVYTYSNIYSFCCYQCCCWYYNKGRAPAEGTLHVCVCVHWFTHILILLLPVLRWCYRQRRAAAEGTLCLYVCVHLIRYIDSSATDAAADATAKDELQQRVRGVCVRVCVDVHICK